MDSTKKSIGRNADIQGESFPGAYIMRNEWEFYIASVDDKSTDEMFKDAMRVVAEHGSASASMLQRRLKIGYNRAANLIDELEAKGIVGAAQGSKPREVLISPDAL